jgi:hypothetical protein
MAWQSPFSAPGHWYKASLHVHTSRSDGRLSPEDALAWYRSHGYDVVALTDHRKLMPGTPATEQDGLLTIAGSELDGPGYHLVALGARSLPEPLDHLEAQAAVTGVRSAGGVAIIAHPYWTGQTSSEIAELDGVHGIEVFNTVCEQERGLGHARQTWDELLEAGVRVWGLAVDDTHWIADEAGQGFVMVRAPELTEEAILAALADGSFYASQGPVIHDLRLVEGDEGLSLRVHCSPCARIVFYAAGPLGKAFWPTAHSVLGTAQMPLSRQQIYLRVECTDAAGRTAWSNPVFTSDVLPEEAGSTR